MRDNWRAARLLAVFGVVACCTQCDLPRGDDRLPDTGVAGLEQKSVLRLLAPPNVRRVGAVIPITVEATFPKDIQEGSHYCVRLAAAPGDLVFPFGDRCASAEVPTSANAAGGNGSGGDGQAGAGGYPAAESDTRLHVTQSCIAATTTITTADDSDQDDDPEVQVTGTLQAAYFAGPTDETASLFGVLYDNKTCRGEPIASTSLLLDLRKAGEDNSGSGGADSSAGAGGTQSMGGSLPTDGGTGGSGGTTSGGSGGTSDGGSGGVGGEAPIAGDGSGGGE